MSFALEGGCFCGEVRYRAQSVFDSGYCHCSMCRRFTGSPALSWFSVPEHHFALVHGTPKGFRSSEHFTRNFCPICGTHVFGRDSRVPSPKVEFRLVSVGIGTLDNPNLVRPQLHEWWADRVCWFSDHDSLPRFEDGTVTHPTMRGRHEP
jgi:hypothetical protein